MSGRSLPPRDRRPLRPLLVLLLAPVSAVLLLLGTAGANLGLWQTLQRQLEDSLHALHFADEPDARIVLVEIDDASLAAAGKRWPWPRGLLAKLVARIGRGAPRVLGIDLLLLSPSARPAEDRALARSLADVDRVVLLEKLVFRSGETRPSAVQRPLPELVRHAKTGFFNFSLDEDSKVRSQVLYALVDGERRPSFARAVQLAWQAGAPPPPSPTLRIPFRGPPRSFAFVSARDVLAGSIPDELFRDRIVLLGATFSDSKDFFATPTSSARRPMAGLEVHANVISALLDGRSIVELPGRWHRLLILAWLVGGAALVLVLGLSRRRAIVALAIWMVAAIGLAAAWWAGGTLLPLVPMSIATLLGAGIGSLGWLVIRRVDRRRKRPILQLPVASADNDSEDDRGQVGIGAPHTGQRQISACAIDVDSFAAIAADLRQRGLDRYLAGYMAGVYAIVDRFGGVLNRNLDAGLVAVFGLDAAHADHALRACRAALDLLRVTQQMEQQWLSEIGVAFRTHAGIHTCEAAVLASGAAPQLQYSVSGPDLDLAARLASSCPEQGARLLISAETGRRVGDRLKLQPVAPIRVRGHRQIVEIFSVLGEVEHEATNRQAQAAR